MWAGLEIKMDPVLRNRAGLTLVAVVYASSLSIECPVSSESFEPCVSVEWCRTQVHVRRPET